MIYEKHGVKEYWIIDPKTMRVEVYRWTAGKLVLDQRVERYGAVESRLLTGFTVDLAYIFSVK